MYMSKTPIMVSYLSETRTIHDTVRTYWVELDSQDPLWGPKFNTLWPSDSNVIDCNMSTGQTNPEGQSRWGWRRQHVTYIKFESCK